MGEKLPFKKLTPDTDIDMSVYDEAIDYAFAYTDIKNVAISGAYGAGKSSVLESYKAKHPDKIFRHISLSHFHDPKQESPGTANDAGNDAIEGAITESILEGKILNQLIHQIPIEKIPQTNFRIKKENSMRQTVKITVFLCFFAAFLSYLLGFQTVVTFASSLDIEWLKSVFLFVFCQIGEIVAVFGCIGCFIMAMYFLARTQINRNIFQKINVQGNEIELFADQDDSYFDKYLNEVLYLFNRADADVIVFEDMDRFNANQIFERLREVNALVNIQRQNKITSKKWSNTVIQYCDKHDNRGVFKLLRNLAQNIEKHSASYTPLRFFYLLRDDIFDTKDRTKFFDYIVPVVPVIDGSNSYEKFDRFLREAGVIEKFDQGFLQGLCLYIDDMRLLKNIYNEFLVYYNRLDKAKPNPNKMMAIITYKNLFPKDFSDLQLGRGFVFALFEQKPSIIRSEIDVAKAKIKALHDRLDAADKEWFKGENEIDFYFHRLDEQIQRQYYYTERERRQNENKAERDRRKQALQDSIQKNREDIERQVKVLEHKILVLQTSWLKDLITRENVAGIFSVTHENEVGTIENFNNIKENNYFNLLKFLIRNGHIDETYQDYMTYFYEGTFTQSDKIFLRRITDRAGAEFTYSLREPQKVIDAPIMREVEFQQEETLNNDLLEFLLLNDTADVYQSYLHILIQQIKEKHRFDFLTQYYNTQKARKEFVVKLNEFWPEFFLLAQRERSISSELVRSFSIDTLCFSDELSLDAINIDNCLTEYISKSADYLAVENPDTPRLIAAFEFLEVCFAKLDYEKSEMGLFKDVYEHHMYELSFENIELMLRAVYFIENSDDIIHKNYTVIRTLPQSALTEYVEENFEAYMALILEHCSGEIVDDYAVVLLVLNNQMLDRTLKNRYISVLSTVLLDLSDVNDTELWATLIEQEIVAPTVQNLVVYFLQHGLDQSLIFYINRLPENFDFSGLSVMLKKGEDEDDSIALATAIEVCSGISIDKYKAILISLGYSFDSFESTALNDEMLCVLIDEKILKMDADGLTFIRKQHRDHIFDFIQQNIDEYLALQTADVFNLEEAKEIATWGIEDNKIITLLSLSSAPITIVGMNFSDRVSAFILGHNLNENDIASLCLHYSDYGNETRAQTVQVIADYLSTVISYDLELDDALLSELFLRDDITSDDKAKFFSCALPRFNEEICKRHFEELGVSELSYIFVKGSRKKYAKNNIITNLLSALKEHGWIYDFFEDDKNPEKYCIIKNRPRERTD